MLFIDSSILYISYAVLTFLSLWVVIRYKGHGLFKAFFIPFALILALSTYISIESLKGLPARTQITEQVQLHWYLISQQTGQIFLWVSRPGGITTPRAYEIPYSELAAKSLESIGKKLRTGFKIILGFNKAITNKSGNLEDQLTPFEYQLEGTFPPSKFGGGLTNGP